MKLHLAKNVADFNHKKAVNKDYRLNERIDEDVQLAPETLEHKRF